MFADDTNLFMTGKSITEIETKMNIELDLLVEWFRTNLLSLNITKTNYIIFSKKRTVSANILMGNTTLVQLSDTKFLGVILSSDLSWNKHINIVVNKISKNIGIISKVRHLLPTSHTSHQPKRFMLYKTLVEPYINYCNLVWASQYKRGNLEKILKVQKKFCRIITFSAFQAHSKPLFRQLGLLSVYDIFRFQLAMFMYRCINNLLPFNKSFNFVANDALYRHETRNRSNLDVVYCRTKCRWLTVQIQGPKIWNSLPGYLRDIPSFIPFRIKINKYILSTAWRCHFINFFIHDCCKIVCIDQSCFFFNNCTACFFLEFSLRWMYVFFMLAYMILFIIYQKGSGIYKLSFSWS